MGVTVPNAGDVFPTWVLDGCATALVLFAAGFGGRQDAQFVADAGLRATCVDTDVKALALMRDAYPEDWNFIVADAFEFPKTTRKMWDLVTVDVYTNVFDRAAQMVQDWCDLARRAVVLGTGQNTRVEAPDGWLIRERLERSAFMGGVYWAVLQRKGHK